MKVIGRRRTSVRGLFLAVAVVVATAPAALAAWTDPETLSPAGQSAFDPQVAVDADGDAVIVWKRSDGTNDRIQARARAADGTLSPVQTLSAAGQDADLPQVAVDPDGDAVIVWTRFDGSNFRVQARARTATGTLSPVQTLSAAGQSAGQLQVAIDADGDAVIVWSRFDGGTNRIQSRARTATGTLSPVQTLSAAGQNANAPQVAMDADGDAVFVWQRVDGPNVRFIEARARATTGTLSAIQMVSAAGQNAFFPQVAVDADGDAVAVWQRFDGSNFRVQARARVATGTLSAVQTLSAAGQDADFPQVAVEADGDAVIVWSRFDGAQHRIQSRARAATGTLSAIQTLSPAGLESSVPQVGIDVDGDAVVVWQGSDGTGNGRIQARARAATGTLSVVKTLSPAGQSALDPQVGVDVDGDAVTVWRLFDGTYSRIQGAAGP